jgi:serine/threonine protein phosphatase PrpC
VPFTIRADEQSWLNVFSSVVSLLGSSCHVVQDEVIVKECFPIPGRGCFSFFGVFDGHGGRAAAIFAREHLFRHLHAALSAGLEPAAALTQAYLETDNAFIAAVRGDDASAVVMTAAAAVIASPALSLPPAAALPSRRQQSANLAVRIPAASLPPVTTSVASARSASAMPLGVSAVPVLPALEKDTSGTTAVCALVEHQSFTLYIGNCGDSRAVLSTTSGAIIPLTNDHKADRADEMERIRRAGGFVVHKVRRRSAKEGPAIVSSPLSCLWILTL